MLYALLLQVRAAGDPDREAFDEWLDAPDAETQEAERRLLADLGSNS